MKLLLIGNHTCGNRGDGAILRGLLTEIRMQRPDAEVTVTSRYPVSSSYLLGRPVVRDPFEYWHRHVGEGMPGKLKKRLLVHVIPVLMAVAVETRSARLIALLPNAMRRHIDEMRQYDAVIQVGGSFFVDLYGSGQYEYPLAAALAGRPLYLLGHSMGPFESTMSRRLVRTLLGAAKQTVLREPVSRELLQRSGLPVNQLLEGVDTAWSVTPSRRTLPPVRWLEQRDRTRPLVAMTVRELAPFDRRLGTTQARYERALADLITMLIARGNDVVMASTCTGIDSYHRDDRMNALRVGHHVAEREHFHVVMDELDDIGLGELFAECDLLIGTRLHSAIIAMNFGTPAIAINYEHKSEGVMRQLGLPELSQPVQALLDGSLTPKALEVLAARDQWRDRVEQAVQRERARAREMLANCLHNIDQHQR